MSYLGNTPTTQNFISGTDYFNGTGSQTAFTLSRTVNSVNDIQVVVNNVVQQPNDAYTLSGTTLTMTSAPSAGTNNVYVRYLSTTTQVITPSQNTVSWNTLDSNIQQDLGVMYKNRIINGNMVIDQRNAGASGTSENTYTLDRWRVFGTQSSKWTWQQSTTAPVGFINSLIFTSSSAYTILSTDNFLLQQPIEGLNVTDLGWGTANAKTVTVSFWVRSSLTGTFAGSIRNAASNRSYVFTYSISSANTWEYKTVTIVGDTTGTWLTTNGIGLTLRFAISAGSNWDTTAGSWQGADYYSTSGAVDLLATNGATWYLTGVQLEVGTQATAFSTAGGSYGAELALCQRYFETSTIGLPTDTAGGFTGVPYATPTQAIGICNFKITKRATPTVTLYSDSGTSGKVLQNGIADNIDATAAKISAGGFSLINRTSGNFNASANYLVLAGYTASIEL